MSREPNCSWMALRPKCSRFNRRAQSDMAMTISNKENEACVIFSKGTALITGAPPGGIGALYATDSQRWLRTSFLVRATRTAEGIADRLDKRRKDVWYIPLNEDLNDREDLAVGKQRCARSSITMLVNNAALPPSRPAGRRCREMDDMMLSKHHRAHPADLCRCAEHSSPVVQARSFNVSSVVAISPRRLNGVLWGTQAMSRAQANRCSTSGR